MSLGKKKIQHQAAAAGITGTDHFNMVTYETDGSYDEITGVGFQPDWVWIKRRNGGGNHYVFDSVRGVHKALFPDETYDETNNSNYLTAFEADGFDLGSASAGANSALVGSGNTYVAWCWKAGGGANTYNIDGTGYSTRSAAGLTSGTIADSKFLGCSTNTTAGFSIIKYNASGASSGQTIDTGLTSDIELMIIKRLDSSGNWIVVDSHTNKYHFLNTTATGVGITFTDYVDGTKSKLYDFQTYVHYCFHSVAGYQKIGSYTGTGATGNAIYTTDDGTSGGANGFEPRFLMIKSSSNPEPWFILDAARDTSNPRDNRLMADSNAAEDDGSVHTVNFDSNGFTANGTLGNGTNGSGVTYIYLAIA